MSEIAEYSPTEAAIAELTHELAGRVYDLTSADGEKEARIDVRSCTRMRTTLEAAREELKRPVLARGRLIDAEAKRIRLLIEAVEEPIAAQLKVIDDAREAEKQKRLAEIEARRTALRKKVFDTFPIPAGVAIAGGKAAALRDLIEKIEATPIDLETWDDLAGEAQQAKAEALEALAPALRIAMEREVREREAAEQRQIAEEKRKADEAEAAKVQAAKDAELAELRAKVAAQPAAPAAAPAPAPLPIDFDELVAKSVRMILRAAFEDDAYLMTKRSVALAIYHGCRGIAEAVAAEA